jgi:glycosyltransferase involved in cell wall biosynthesis
MPLLSAIVTCKGRLEHLKLTLPALMALPDCEVVVVDYDCPDGAAAWVRDGYPAAKVVQLSDRPFFNLAKARNAGAALATAPWLLLIDADVIVEPTLTKAVRPNLRPGVFMWAVAEARDLAGTKIVARDDFINVGGYDEVFEGWGAEDTDLADRLSWIGRRPTAFPPRLLTSIPHDDALRGRFHENATPHVRINTLYRNAKMDLLRQGVRLDEAGRRRLYADLGAVAWTADGLGSAQIVFRDQTFGDRVLITSLRYEWRKAE